MIKIGTQNRETSQVLSQVLEYFFGGVYEPLSTVHLILTPLYCVAYNLVQNSSKTHAQRSFVKSEGAGNKQ